MDFLSILFPVSGVKTNILFPPAIALIISFFASMGGLSGAFLLLPFQMSYLHYTAPSVSGTNHVFNIFAIPSGVYRYIREGRMAWPITWVIIIGTLPGVFLGYYLRVRFLPDPATFRFFVGCVLFYIGIRLFTEAVLKGTIKSEPQRALEQKFRENVGKLRKDSGRFAAGVPSHAVVHVLSISAGKIEYEFWGELFSFNPVWLAVLSLLVGIVGGAYGIGGGAIIVPFCVTVFHLPVYTIAGAALLGTFVTSLAGALFFTFMPAINGISSLPDWPLGFLFGVGGFIGVYFGARLQKYVPQKAIKLMLGTLLLFLSLQYIIRYLW